MQFKGHSKCCWTVATATVVDNRLWMTSGGIEGGGAGVLRAWMMTKMTRDEVNGKCGTRKTRGLKTTNMRMEIMARRRRRERERRERSGMVR
jgi:hypothetical protein